jgi:hypothetical protein
MPQVEKPIRIDGVQDPSLGPLTGRTIGLTRFRTGGFVGGPAALDSILGMASDLIGVSSSDLKAGVARIVHAILPGEPGKTEQAVHKGPELFLLDPVAAIEHRLPLELWRQDFTKLIDIADPQAIEVSMNLVKSSGDLSGDQQIRVTGPLSALGTLGRAMDVDFLLYGLIAQYEQSALTLEMKYQISRTEEERYRREYEAFKGALENRAGALNNYRQQLFASHQAELNAFDEMLRIRPAVTPSEKETVDEDRKSFQHDYEELEKKSRVPFDELTRLESATKSIESYQEKVEAMETVRVLPVARVQVLAKLIDARTGKIVWIRDIFKQHSDLERALGEVISTLVQELGGAKSQPAVEKAPGKAAEPAIRKSKAG